MKKFIGWLIIGLLLAGTICGVYFGISYYSLDIETALEEEYDKGYSDALNGSESNYMILYQQALADLQIAQNDKSELQSQLENALNENSDNHDLIQNLRNQLSSKDNEIDALEDTVTLYQLMLEAYEDIDKLQVTFVLFDNGDETPYAVQFVDENEYLSEVVTPTASDFEGWSLSKGGELIEDITTMQVTEDMTIYGMFTNTVTFMVNGEEYTTQEVSYNQYATDVEVSLVGYTCNGWSLTENGELVTVSTMSITADTTFYAVMEKIELTGLEEYSWNVSTNLMVSYIWTDSKNTYYSYRDEQYVLNKETKTWDEKIWYGLSSFNGSSIWTDGQNIYYSGGYSDPAGDYAQYVLDEKTSTWTEKTWYGISDLMARDIWTDGENFYFSQGPTQYVLNKETSTWTEKTWNSPIAFFGDDRIWTDGQNIYYSSGSYQYQLDKDTSTWIEKIWYGLSNFDGPHIWTDGENYYYSSGTHQYQLNKETSTWTEKTWVGLSSFYGRYVWTDGTNIYYSNGSDQYIFV